MNDIREKKITWISKFCLFNYWLSIFSAVLFLFCLIFSILVILSGKLNIHGTWIELPLVQLLWMGMIFWILSYFFLLANGAHLTFSGIFFLIALIFGKSSKNRDKTHILISLVIGVIIFSIALYIYPFVINFSPDC